MSSSFFCSVNEFLKCFEVFDQHYPNMFWEDESILLEFSSQEDLFKVFPHLKQLGQAISELDFGFIPGRWQMRLWQDNAFSAMPFQRCDNSTYLAHVCSRSGAFAAGCEWEDLMWAAQHVPSLNIRVPVWGYLESNSDANVVLSGKEAERAMRGYLQALREQSILTEEAFYSSSPSPPLSRLRM